MNRDQIRNKVKGIICINIFCCVSIIDDNSVLIHDLDCDSLDIIEVIMDIEDHFEIEISDSEFSFEIMDKFRVVDLIDIVEEKLNENTR